MALVRHRFKWMGRWMDRQTVSTSKQFFMPYTIYIFQADIKKLGARVEQ